MKPMDVAAIGELLIDFTPGGQPWAYQANPGGAPANLLTQVARLGGAAGFLGMVGDDAFGGYLRQTLDAAGVCTGGLLVHPTVHTTLAFVHIDAQGDRSFTFYRQPGADTQYSPGQLDYPRIDSARLFHFGGVSMSKSPMREATLAAAEYARAQGKPVSFDPNYRPPLWDSGEEAVRWMRQGVELCHILKLSQEEAQMLTGLEDPGQAAQAIRAMGPTLVLVTLGAGGCTCAHPRLSRHFATYDTRVVDTTGAGDAFFGALISRLLRWDGALEDLPAPFLEESISYANAAGALCAAGYGAIPSLADDDAIRRCMAEVPLL